MGLPSIDIVFKSKAIKAIEQGAVGTLAVVLKDSSVTTGIKEYKLRSITDIPADFSVTNQGYLEQAFMGIPKEIKAVVIPGLADNYNDALDYLETIQFNIGVIPGIDELDTTTIASWVKAMRANMDRKVLFVLPNTSADSEGVINVTTDNILVGAKTYTASEYLGRIAGLIAGLSLRVAPTYQVFPEIEDVPHLTRDEADAAIDAGEFILYHDGEKVKVGRGVTSLVTTTEDINEDWKKIKLVRIYDKVYTDVYKTIEDEYIGKVQNSYENKLLLISAITAYFEVLEQEGILDPGKNICRIDVAAQKTYLRSIGYEMPDGRGVDDMDEQEIKEANTKDKVFLESYIKGLDAIEDFKMVVHI